MDILSNLYNGFGAALIPQNLFFTILGQLIGISVGILPGINSSMAVATLLPLTFGLTPTASLVLLSGIYMGSMFGGSITSILLRVPGTSTAAVICLDGYEMTCQGRAGCALGITAIGSWIAGTFSLLVLMSAGPLFSEYALSFGPPEYFALVFLGLTMITSLGSDSMVKGLMAGAFGLMLGTVGIDPVTGVNRFTFGQVELLNGVDFIAVLIGMFAVAQSLANLENKPGSVCQMGNMTSLLPSWKEIKESAWSIVRGSVLGTFIGILPGAGATTAAFLSYSMEAQIAKDKTSVGKGNLACVAGPGSADNAASGGALIPLFSLGIPGSETTAVLIGALMIHGIRPRPLALHGAWLFDLVRHRVPLYRQLPGVHPGNRRDQAADLDSQASGGGDVGLHLGHELRGRVCAQQQHGRGLDRFYLRNRRLHHEAAGCPGGPGDPRPGIRASGGKVLSAGALHVRRQSFHIYRPPHHPVFILAGVVSLFLPFILSKFQPKMPDSCQMNLEEESGRK